MPNTPELAKFIEGRMTKRRAFLAAQWEPGRDLMPANPLADPRCGMCGGHGVCDAGYDTGCVLVNCPVCWV